MHPRRKIVKVIIIILLIGFFSSYFTYKYADDILRKNLLIQTAMIAAALDADQISSLQGSEADIGQEPYEKLKHKLEAIRVQNPNAQFTYIFGKNEEGEVVFLVDNEPPISEDYSPPGQVYFEASPELLDTFSTGIGFVEGPFKDRWGVWVSGLVPIRDPQTQQYDYIFGLDIDASDWRGELLGRVMVPIFLTIFGLALVFLLEWHHKQRFPLTIRRKK